MIYILAYLVISVMISFFSFGKRISFFGALMINIFLTPFVGLISIIRAKKKIITHHYKMKSVCTSCKTETKEILDFCPICGQNASVYYTEINDIKLAYK